MPVLSNLLLFLVCLLGFWIQFKPVCRWRRVSTTLTIIRHQPVSKNLTNSDTCLPSGSIRFRFHRLKKVQSYKTTPLHPPGCSPPPPDSSCKSRLLLVFLTNWLQIRGSHNLLHGFV